MFASDVYCERVKYFDLHLIKITQLFCIAQQTELLMRDNMMLIKINIKLLIAITVILTSCLKRIILWKLRI